MFKEKEYFREQKDCSADVILTLLVPTDINPVSTNWVLTLLGTNWY